VTIPEMLQAIKRPHVITAMKLLPSEICDLPRRQNCNWADIDSK
jgi:hypothetical protein